MNTLTYKQAYDKIIDAYFKDEIKPLAGEFCFCGTLNDNNINWCGSFVNGEPLPYSLEDFSRMEDALFEPLLPLGVDKIEQTRWVTGGYIGRLPYGSPWYETALFAGMTAALEVLKQIHTERGEIIDEVPVFAKRELNRQS